MAIDFNNPDAQDLMRQLRILGLNDAQAGYIAGIPVDQRQQAFDNYVNEMVPKIGAFDLAQFQSQRDQLKMGYQQNLAKLDFSQGNADQDYATARGNLVRQFDQMREKLPYSYNARGLMNSGVYSQGLQDYGDQRLRSFGEFEQKRQQQQAGYGLQKQQFADSYRGGMAQVDQLEKARRAQIAAQIKAAQ